MNKQELTAMVAEILGQMGREPTVKASDYHPTAPQPRQTDSGDSDGDFVPDVTALNLRKLYLVEHPEKPDQFRLLKEKTPARDWGFTYLKEGYIICHTSARKWEIIRTEDLETVEEIPDKLFGKGEWCINSIRLTEEGKLVWRGFQDVWDDSVQPPEMLPNRETQGEVVIQKLMTEDSNHGT